MPKLNVVAGIIDKVADKIDEFTLDKTEKAELIQEINKAQIEVNKVEADIAIAYSFQVGVLLLVGLVV
jgi:chaperonin cofactor prefoldin